MCRRAFQGPLKVNGFDSDLECGLEAHTASPKRAPPRNRVHRNRAPGIADAPEFAQPKRASLRSRLKRLRLDAADAGAHALPAQTHSI